MSGSRENWADQAKGIGILLVVYGHVARGLESAGLFPNEGVFRVLDNSIYLFHMPLFFFLSGYFFWGGYKKNGPFLLSDKVDKILIPYVVWSVAQGVVEVLMAAHTNRQATWAGVLNLTIPRAQFWFLQSLFAMFLLCTVIAYVGVKRRGLWLVVTLFAAFLYCLNVREGFLGKFLPFFVFFVIGAAVFRWRDHFESMIKNHLSNFGALILFAGMLAVFLSSEGFDYEDRGVFTLLLSSAAIICIVGMASSLSGVGGRFFGYLGKRSFDIFILHIILGSGARIFMHKFFGVNEFTVHLIVGILLGTAGSLFVADLMRWFGVGFLFGPTWVKEMTARWRYQRVV